MPEQSQPQMFTSDLQLRIRDAEERQRLLNERVILLGKTFVEEREKSFKEIQTLKKDMAELKSHLKYSNEYISKISLILGNVARKEELQTLQKQLDILRENK